MKNGKSKILGAFFVCSCLLSAKHVCAESQSTRPNPRQQINEITAYLDGSVIYGCDPVRAAALRSWNSGKLKTSNGNLPPYNTYGLPNANDAHLFADDELFLAGDVRANENVQLTAVQTLLVREHNLIADTIASLYPGLNDETIYQWARMIVGAELQVITYNEFLPALLGSGAIPPYRGYKPNVNPGIANEFSTAAFRVGHTLINDHVGFLDNDLNPVRAEIELRDAFFNPLTIEQVGIEPILKHMASDNAQEVDLKLVDGLRNFLFGPPGAGGFDLASRNIQRGRDHGLADYNTTRQSYGLPAISDFSEITSDTDLQNKLQSLYGSVDNIDLWVGGLAEDHVRNASVGRTFRRIIADQFRRIRDGDSFWYTRIFDERAQANLENTRLSDIIRRNSTAAVQDNVFFFNRGDNLASVIPAPSVESLVRSAARTLRSTRNFRTLNGSDNNRFQPSWGKAGIKLLRMAPAAYPDGFSEPAGQDRPSAREISNTVNVLDDPNQPRNDRNLADWIHAWGQLIDHDLDLTTTGTTSFNIPVPAGDHYFDPFNTGAQVIDLKRSIYSHFTGEPLAHKHHKKKKSRNRR